MIIFFFLSYKKNQLTDTKLEYGYFYCNMIFLKVCLYLYLGSLSLYFTKLISSESWLPYQAVWLLRKKPSLVFYIYWLFYLSFM